MSFTSVGWQALLRGIWRGARSRSHSTRRGMRSAIVSWSRRGKRRWRNARLRRGTRARIIARRWGMRSAIVSRSRRGKRCWWNARLRGGTRPRIIARGRAIGRPAVSRTRSHLPLRWKINQPPGEYEYREYSLDVLEKFHKRKVVPLSSPGNATCSNASPALPSLKSLIRC